MTQPGWTGLWTSLEIALLLCLVSSESGNRKLALQCVQVAATILDSAHGPAVDSASSSNILRAFATEYRSRSLTSGSRSYCHFNSTDF